MCDKQLREISTLHDLFLQWTKNVPTYPRQNKAPRAPPKKPPEKGKTKKTIQIVNRPPDHLPPSPAQVPRVQVMQTPPHSAPRLDIIPPPYTTNITETNTDKPIAHRTQARRTTPATPLQRIHEPVPRRTRSQISPNGIAQQVDISPRQAS